MSRQLFEEARKVLTQEAAVKLDPVGQEDKDIDNDRDVDKTDKYLHKRRKAISAAIASSKNESSLSDEDIAKLKDILGEQDMTEAKADPTSTWVVYHGDKVKRFKTREGATAHAEKHGGKVASSAHYADKIQGKQSVAEEVEDEVVSEGRPYSAMHRLGRYGSTRRYSPTGYGTTTGNAPTAAPAKPAKPAPKPGEDEAKKNEEVEQINEIGDTPAGRQMLGRYIKKAAQRAAFHSAIATHSFNTANDDTADPAQRKAAETRVKVHNRKSDRRLLGIGRATNTLTQEEIEQEDFELIENLNITVPDNPSYQDYIKAALTIAECNSFSELSEEDQQYIISEMENAFRNNDIDFIVEAEALSDMNDTVQRLRKAGHKVEDMGKDYKGQPFYVYVDKGTGLRRKVTYKGNQKVTQNMGKAAAEDSNEA